MTRPGIRPFLRSLFGRDLQSRITREFERALRNGAHSFPDRIALPSPFGRGMPERVVELLLARLSYLPGLKVLDIGHANSMACHRNMIRSLPGPRRLTGIDIADPVYDASALYEASVRASIDSTPFAAGEFDLIWCISSFEHFGMDNSGYLEGTAVDERIADAALTEIVRVLEPNGTLLLTVPYGRFEHHGWFRNFDERLLGRFVGRLRAVASVRELYFAHDASEGWRAAEPASLRDVGYHDQKNAGASALAALVVRKER
jgi:SAM-dependent methyltransferase